jgi:hypothetical protein
VSEPVDEKSLGTANPARCVAFRVQNTLRANPAQEEKAEYVMLDGYIWRQLTYLGKSSSDKLAVSREEGSHHKDCTANSVEALE